MEQTHHPVRPGTSLALHAQALPPPASAWDRMSRSSDAWLGIALLLAAIAGIGLQAPVTGLVLAAACSLALLRTASKAKKKI